MANDEERARAAIARIDVLWLSLGRMQDGLRVAEEVEAAIADAGLRTEVSSHRAGLVLGSEVPRAAVRVLEPLLTGAQGRSLVWMGVVGAFGLGRLGRLREGLDVADRAHEAGVALTEPDDWYPWFNLHARCEVLVQAGRFADAERLAREQHQRGLDEGSSEARAWFLWNLSRTVRDRGNVRPAARDAREAVTLLHRLGLLGVQHTLLSLLAQEQALAGDAAAAGHTDRDIAAELQLSVRTVGNRLQRVYHKLGVSRRTDLARLLR
ncbi:LuxR family transcriptional regulator [Candidatus Protofrankia californiensis]|uniref:LuxR family transcriptional regulator n=1 Tax=Candidatus Protofrankia californiensis TaxID=1839754 RepID=A0A1C3NZG5_9ACTN|nr:LuxR family transcriptional regulator [Candidatus Protofrankia californiensis]